MMNMNPLRRLPHFPAGHELPHFGGGHHGAPHPHYHGFCHHCGHPRAMCLCGCRECRKEAKELLVVPGGIDRNALSFARRMMAGGTKLARATLDPAAAAKFDFEELLTTTGLPGRQDLPVTETLNAADQPVARSQIIGIGANYLGGGCCVHLSVEYTAIEAGEKTDSAVAVLTLDADHTLLAWAKYDIPPGYYIKEDIITTDPGSILAVIVVAAIARVRWCEVFSC